MIPISGWIVQIFSGSAPSFVAKYRQMIKDFLVNKKGAWSEIKEHIIAPFLKAAHAEKKTHFFKN